MRTVRHDGDERWDAVVIGASIRGLVTTYVLQSLGCRAVLLERSPRIGGADGSFVTAGGSRFDFGLHVLDHMRTAVATRLFQKVVGGRVHRQTLRRAIALRGQVMPYNPAPGEMPPELAALLPPGELVDDLGADLPTRERLAAIYGRGFVDLVFDEVLPSYPTEHRHRAFGVDEARLLTNIYPWFFPRAVRRSAGQDESRRFHDRLRAGEQQDVLYPQDGGFGGFAAGFVQAFDPGLVEVRTGVADLQVELAGNAHRVARVRGAGRRFVADHVFWAAAWPPLCALLDLPCQDVATDRVVLGSFTLDRPPISDFHEILVGDPALHVNRISLPAKFRGADEPLLQVEFAFPVAEDWPTDAAHWQARWVADLGRLGVLTAAHRVVEFDFKSFPLHFNAFGVEGEPLQDADPAAIHQDSNLRPVVPSMANLNLNGYVPQVVRYVTEVVTG